VQPIRPVASDGSTDQAKPLLIFARVCSQKDFPTSWYVTRRFAARLPTSRVRSTVRSTAVATRTGRLSHDEGLRGGSCRCGGEDGPFEADIVISSAMTIGSGGRNGPDVAVEMRTSTPSLTMR
jgi:hypothetical protein